MSKRGRGHVFTLRPDQCRRIMQRLKSGEKVQVIARDMHVDPSTLRRHLRDTGIEPTDLGFCISKN